MHFLRSIQLDASDPQVFEHAAESGEWAVPGSFALLGIDPRTRDPKQREAFRHGFIGTDSFGHSSLVTVADISPAGLSGVIDRIAAHLRRHCGAPTDSAARSAAEEEVSFTLELSAHPIGTLIALQRELVDDGIEESYRTVSQPEGVDHSQMRLWAMVD
jgi:Family of unknown function (DUF6505)